MAYCTECGNLMENNVCPKCNRAVFARINTKQDEIKSANQIGPWVLTGIGVLLFFFLWWLGVILVIAGCAWGLMRENQVKKLKNEIKELESSV